jgi:hypothetical protein
VSVQVETILHPVEVTKETIEEGKKVLVKVNHLALDIIPLPGNNGGLIGQAVAFAIGDQKYITAEIKDISQERLAKFKEGKESVSLIEQDGKVYVLLDGKDKFEVIMNDNTFATIAANPSILQGHNSVFLNGIMNSEKEAMRNGFMQLGTDKFIISYDPTHGLIPDLLEVGWNKFFGESAPAMNVQQDLEFNKVLLANGINPANIKFAAHSAGGARLYLELVHADDNSFGGAKTQFSGTPINTNNLEQESDDAGAKFIVHQINDGDGVGNALGGNSTTVGDKVYNFISLPVLFTSASPHSNYRCDPEFCD